MLRCQLTDEILRSLHRASALGDVLTRLERHPIECRAIGTRLRRTEHQHGRSRVSLPDLGGDVAQRRVDPAGSVSNTTILRSMPFSLAFATTSASSDFGESGGALTPSSRTSAITRFIQVSTGVVAGSRPTGAHTSGGMYAGRNGMTCGPVTRARYAMGTQSSGSTRPQGQDSDKTAPSTGVVCRTSVLLGLSAPPTQPVAARSNRELM